MKPASSHGFVRGSLLPRQSRLFEGRFGRMFRSVPEFALDPNAIASVLEEISLAMSPSEDDGPTHETVEDGEENPNIAAGYTYLGQFIDHDITFDPVSSLQRLNDPEALTDFRTPRFDLDSVYGRGPADQPYMFTGDERLFELGRKLQVPGNPHFDEKAVDHLRAAKGRALIGDKRNDENVIVAQLHTLFMRFHNRFATDHETGKNLTFAELQQEVRWHYQWIVLHDYLPVIVGQDLVNDILPHLVKRTSIHADPPKLRFYEWKNDPFIPTEFSVAAFRFGHSMVRPVYRLSRTFELLKADKITEQPDKDGKESDGLGRRMIFDVIDEKALNGFKPIIDKWSIEWDLYFKMSSTGNDLTKGRVQPSYKVDTSMVNPLANLPEFKGMGNSAMLPFRNLMRGFSMRLPCGEDVAKAMSEKPLEEEWRKIGRAEDMEEWNKNAKHFSEFGFEAKPFAKKTPLWLYILAEGAKNTLTGNTAALGPVGGRIIAETMIGMMLGDTHSYLNLDPQWTPSDDVGGEKLNMARFIQYAVNRKVDA